MEFIYDYLSLLIPSLSKQSSMSESSQNASKELVENSIHSDVQPLVELEQLKSLKNLSLRQSLKDKSQQIYDRQQQQNDPLELNTQPQNVSERGSRKPSTIYSKQSNKYGKQKSIRNTEKHFELHLLNQKQEFEIPHTGMTYQNLPKLVLVVSLICISSFYYGYELTVLSSVTSAELTAIYTSQVTNKVLNAFLGGGIPLGAIFGSLLSNRMIIFFTRKKYLLLVNLFAIIINLISLAPNVWLLLVCRIFQGVFVGLYLGIVPIYIHQICPHCISGSFGAFTQLAHVLGVVICYFIGMIFYLLNDVTEIYVVAIQFEITTVLVIIQTILFLINFIPESPNSLLITNQIDKARQILELFHGDENLEQLIQQKQLQNENIDLGDENISINESLAVDKITLSWKNGLLGFMLPFMQQMTGVNFLVTQTGKIIGKFDPTLEPYAALIVNSVQFVAIALSILVLSKVGRKPLLQFGNIGIGLINVILGILFFYIEIWKIAFPLTFFFICLFMVVYGFTLGPVIWLYVPEIIPTNIVPLAITMNWIGCSFCVIVCPIISESMNGNPWLIFIFLGAIQLLMFIPNILFVVETKGLPAYEINAKFK